MRASAAIPDSGPPPGRCTSIVIWSAATGSIVLLPVSHQLLTHCVGNPRVGSPVPGAAEAGEDLVTLRVVPVAERGPEDVAARRPCPAAQDLVLVTEEHLGVLRVGERLEAR